MHLINLLKIIYFFNKVIDSKKQIQYSLGGEHRITDDQVQVSYRNFLEIN